MPWLFLMWYLFSTKSSKFKKQLSQKKPPKQNIIYIICNNTPPVVMETIFECTVVMHPSAPLRFCCVCSPGSLAFSGYFSWLNAKRKEGLLRSNNTKTNFTVPLPHVPTDTQTCTNVFICLCLIYMEEGAWSEGQRSAPRGSSFKCQSSSW